MSGLIVGLVLRLPITDDFTSEAKFVATVYADYAWEDGSHAYPAVETVATRTGYNARTVQRHLRTLEKHLLTLAGKGPRGTNQYAFQLRENPDGTIGLIWRGGDTQSPPVETENKADSGDTQSPRQAAGGDNALGDNALGDTRVTRINQLPVINDEEEGKNQISKDLRTELKELGIFVSVWKDIENKVFDGMMSEADVVALIDWMTETRRDKTKAAQGFVARLREGTKAPQEYYRFGKRRALGKWYPRQVEVTTEPAEPTEPDQEPMVDCISAQSYAMQIWGQVLDSITASMPKGKLHNTLTQAQVGGLFRSVLKITCASQEEQELLESRLTSTINRALIGIANGQVRVEFVAVETEVLA